MEDTLKARLIGATVLVGLAVLLIPELLSGRKPAEQATAQAGASRGTRTFTIELGSTPGTSVVTEDASKPAPASAPPAQPVPRQASGAEAEAAVAATNIQSAGESTEPSPQPASAARVVAPEAPPEDVVRPAAESAPADSAPAQVVPARGGWAVQVGAFGSAEAANKLVGQLQSADFAAYVAPVSRSGKTLHRVRVGPVTARAGAEALVPALKARGLPATVVAND
jgi:cell division septation protein DedD